MNKVLEPWIKQFVVHYLTTYVNMEFEWLASKIESKFV
jgi:hypothetical protein